MYVNPSAQPVNETKRLSRYCYSVSFLRDTMNIPKAWKAYTQSSTSGPLETSGSLELPRKFFFRIQRIRINIRQGFLLLASFGPFVFPCQALIFGPSPISCERSKSSLIIASFTFFSQTSSPLRLHSCKGGTVLLSKFHPRMERNSLLLRNVSRGI